tara:strand:+ start:10950 stop:11339 length:390 start_codon:yes stop_codon:yes gene_type:complete
MPSATLNFSAPINVSCQVGDTAYYVDTSSVGGFTVSTNSVASQENTIVEIGEIREIQGPKTNTPAIIVETTLGYNELNGLNRFIFFSKNNKANLSSPLGYYASVKFVNDNSYTTAELYAIEADIYESSK